MLNLPLQHLYKAASAAETSPWLLVLMHGVGSNEEDLFGLADFVPPAFHVLSLRAPYTMAPHMYAWFQFSVNPDGSRNIDDQQEKTSRALVEQACQQACEQLQIPPERVVLGGFSQGGIMSLSVLLTQPALLRAVLVWHSRLLPQIAAREVDAAQLAEHKAWVSHGTEDDVIPLAQAHAIRSHLQATPLELSYHEYPCRHQLHPQELRESMQWLQALARG
ncbi:alpha/beta hydrolase [Comamonas sp. J-3]|uniref:alpha/beta hydrolase n=1 Tax=Comamonas trifloxystrobinivorans TaxID=3350256 RepID=UPI00372B12F3